MGEPGGELVAKLWPLDNTFGEPCGEVGNESLAKELVLGTGWLPIRDTSAPRPLEPSNGLTERPGIAELE